MLSEKGNVKNEIKIVKDNVIIDDNQAVAEEFNSNYTNVVQELNIDFNWNTDENIESIKDPIQKAIERYKSHPSIIVIREKLSNPNIIDFVDIKENELEKMMANFNTKKGTSFGSVPGKILKDNRKIIKEKLTEIVNIDKKECKFSNQLKLGDINPAFKPGKKNRTDMDSYRPLTVLPYLSKIPERDIKEQLMDSLESILNPNLCGYRKGFSTQHALISMLEKWKTQLDKKGYAGAVLMDLSKAFDCINHELLIAKLAAYGLSDNAL